MMAFPLSSAVEPVQPDEVRATRRVNGWSVEDLADVLRVSPQQVEAWEAGSLAPEPEEVGWIRWHWVMGLRDCAMAAVGVAPCPWTRAVQARPAADRRGSHPSDLARPGLARHVAACPVCRPLAEAGVQGFLADPVRWLAGRWRAAGHLPLRARITTRVLVPGGVIGLLGVLGSEGAEGSPVPFVAALACFAGYLAFLVIHRPLLSLAKNHLYLAWQAGFAAVLFTMLAVVGAFLDVALADPGTWIFTGGIALVLGGLMGYYDARARREVERQWQQAAQAISPHADPNTAPRTA
ncbi:MAG TPA: hypothetical protein VGX50_16240 [Longimicrobium sp.]|nr:hypothetical protein [Longimicrobium sp.]